MPEMSDLRTDDGIAVIGMACRLPGARDTAEFWRNLRDVTDSVRIFAEEELRAAGVSETRLNDPQYVRAGAEPKDLAHFDAGLFGFTPRDATRTDPQIRLFLEVAHAAVEDAGYDPFRIPGAVGVYGAMGGGRYAQLYLSSGDQDLSAGRMALSLLNMPDYLATLVSYKFGLCGPSMTVYSACSSSLVATHLAAQALRLGECDVAIAGGADVVFPTGHGYVWNDGGPVSRDGHCRPFDVSADGTIFGSGAGAVILKRLDDAIADGDDIRAVIRGSAVNNDGATKVGFTAPGVPNQAVVIQEAMLMAGMTPADLSYVEAHATGTALGDPVELTALARAHAALGGTPRSERLPVSSVKGNIGHIGHAAGIASLIKVVLSLQHKQRPGTANFTKPNPQLLLEQTPFTVTGQSLPWPAEAGRPRAAGLSALGFGGTNAHMVLTEAPDAGHRSPVEDKRPQVLLWSGRSETATAAYAAALSDYLGSTTEALVDVAGTLQDGRTPHRVRRAVVVPDGATAVAMIERGSVIATPATDGKPAAAPAIAMLFPGQAAQQPRMARGLYGTQPAFTDTMDECLRLFAEQGMELATVWDEAGADRLADTLLAQPLLFCVEYSLAQMWRAAGIEPAVVIGHSIGELAAATIAGVFDLPGAAALVAMRARAMAAAPQGGMLGVAAAADTLTPLLPSGVTVAVTNGPRQTVLSGAPDALAVAAQRLGAERIAFRELSVGKAFHSPLMAGAVPEFQQAFRDVQLAEPSITLISAATGRPVSAADAKDPAFWANQISQPVRFDHALDSLAATGATLLIEVGPGHTLSHLARAHPAVTQAGATTVPTLSREVAAEREDAPDHRDETAVLTAAATVWTQGHTVDWRAVRGRPTRRVPLPGYPYQRERYWPDAVPGVTGADPAPSKPGVAAVPEVARTGPFSVLSWVERQRAASRSDGGAALALLPDGAAAMPVVLALQRAGYRPVVVRPGDGYRAEPADLRVRPGVAVDVERLLADLAARGIRPDVVVHALAIQTGDISPHHADRRLDETVHTLNALAQAAVRADRRPRLVVLTARAVDITGAESLDPFNAALTGTVTSLAAETPELRCRLIDLGEVSDPRALAAELGCAVAGDEVVVALRGPARWVRVERPWRQASVADGVPEPALPVRPGGVYLLAGGLGGLGLIVARALASTGLQPKLVLAGRSAAENDEATRAAVDELTALGAHVRIERCDIADRRALRRLADTLRAHLGPVNGIVHLAGVAGDGMLVVRDRADVEAVLRPKVHGSLALADVFGGDVSLDFYLAFSSRAAIGGLLGGGDYAAANSFLDAHTRLLRRGGTRALSVNWPAWRNVGMAVAPPAGAGYLTSAFDADPATNPVLDEHRSRGVPIVPGAGIVDGVTRAFRELVGPPDALVGFEEVIFRRPLAAPAKRAAHITLKPDGSAWRWEFWAGHGPSRVTYATGRIGILPPDAAAELAHVEPLTAVRDRLRDPEPAPDSQPARLFTLGPRWSGMTEVETTDLDQERPGGRERLSELTTAAAFHAEMADFPLYPPLLDRCTSAARTRATSGGYLPFHYGRLRMFGELPPNVVSYIRPKPAGDGLIVADITIYAADGRPLVIIDDYTMRRLATDELPTATSARADSHRSAGAGLDPEHGAALFMTLLRLDGPPNIAVRPYADGGHLPMRDTALPPTTPAEPVPTADRTTVVAKPQAPLLTAPVAAESVADRLAGLWTRVLGIPAVQPADDFFELGGNSLVAVELIADIRDTFGVSTNIVTVFEHTRLDALARALAEQGAR
jgi:phthiocerol/phenolphthiocerol synthesis type-I polyketide synthase E